MLGMDTLWAITGGRSSAKEPVATAADQEPVQIDQQMAEVHRVYPVANTATDVRITELLRLIEQLRADRDDLLTDRDAWRGLALQARRGWWWSRRASTRS
jgi:hypothetical protein